MKNIVADLNLSEIKKQHVSFLGFFFSFSLFQFFERDRNFDVKKELFSEY